MLLPDNIHPEHSIYYNAAFVIQIIQQLNPTDLNLLDLYLKVKHHHEMSMSVFVLCLDWLFLLDLITLSDSGRIKLCI